MWRFVRGQSAPAGCGTPLITTRARSWRRSDDGRTTSFGNSNSCWHRLASRGFTDGWGAYERHLEAEQHQVGKENTQTIESKPINLRTRIKRFGVFPRHWAVHQSLRIRVSPLILESTPVRHLPRLHRDECERYAPQAWSCNALPQRAARTGGRWKLDCPAWLEGHDHSTRTLQLPTLPIQMQGALGKIRSLMPATLCRKWPTPHSAVAPACSPGPLGRCAMRSACAVGRPGRLRSPPAHWPRAHWLGSPLQQPSAHCPDRATHGVCSHQ